MDLLKGFAVMSLTGNDDTRGQRSLPKVAAVN